MKKYLKFGESRKEKALTNDNSFNNHLSELFITQQQNLCLLFILIASSPARISARRSAPRPIYGRKAHPQKTA